MIRRPPRSTRTDTLFPSTTLCRSRRLGRRCIGIERDPDYARIAEERIAGIEPDAEAGLLATTRSEEQTSELQSLMRMSYGVFCLKKKRGQEAPKYRYDRKTCRLTSKQKSTQREPSHT